MSHYFTNDSEHMKSNPKVIAFRVNDVALSFHTDNGIFSKDGLDRGTSVLLEYFEMNPEIQTALDLGCGYGVVGIYLAKQYHINVDFVDVNLNALELTKQNLLLNNVDGTVFESNGFSRIDKKYDLIITNPPIRAGKKIVYAFFEGAKQFLTPNGEFYTVINKKHGALSAIEKLKTIYNSVEIINRKKGFYVIRCKI